MTKKDYELIAAAFKSSTVSNTIGDKNKKLWNDGVRYAAHCMAASLANDNPRFNRDTFLEACGVQS